MADTSIEWTDKVWNPTTGCDRVSPGCDHCYALTMAARLKGMGSAKYQNDGDPRTSGPGFLAVEHESDLDAPLRWAKPRKVFVNSMSDLFHDRISDEFIARVFGVMSMAQRHTFQVLTKRHARMRSLLNSAAFLALVAAEVSAGDGEVYRRKLAGWPLPNVWLGVSVENQQWADIRIPALLGTPAAVRWLSCEPLLSSVDLSRWISGRERGDRVGVDNAASLVSGRDGPDLEVAGGDARCCCGGQGGGVHSAAGGHRPVGGGRLPTRAGDYVGGACDCSCTSDRVDGRQPANDPASAGGQPQERDQARQPSREPGVGDSFRERGARSPRAGALPVDQGREAHAGAGAGGATDSVSGPHVAGRPGGAPGCQCQHVEEDRDPSDVGVARGPAGISWVVVGGESGAGARPMHPDWARSLRNQCQAAGVPYMFKQHGAWAPIGPLYGQSEDVEDVHMDALYLEVNQRREVVQLEPSGVIVDPREHQPGLGTWLMARVGKKAAGRELDGRTWDQFPEISAGARVGEGRTRPGGPSEVSDG